MLVSSYTYIHTNIHKRNDTSMFMYRYYARLGWLIRLQKLREYYDKEGQFISYVYTYVSFKLYDTYTKHVFCISLSFYLK